MKCPSCGGAELAPDTRDFHYVYKGERTVIPGAAGEYCPVCGEGVFADEESERISAAMLDFNRRINASIVDPAYISRVRKKLKLGQQEAARIFGGGINAFSRYERGKTKPPLSLVKLFMVLDRHPELLNEIRSNDPGEACSPLA